MPVVLVAGPILLRRTRRFLPSGRSSRQYSLHIHTEAE